MFQIRVPVTAVGLINCQVNACCHLTRMVSICSAVASLAGAIFHYCCRAATECTEKPTWGNAIRPIFHTISSEKKIKNVSERQLGQNAPAGPTPVTLQISMYKTGFLGSATSNRKRASPCKPSATTFDFQWDRMGAAFFCSVPNGSPS